VGRRIWVYTPKSEHEDFTLPESVYDVRVLKIKQFLPQDERRKKHLIQLWTDPGGLRTLAVGSIKLKKKEAK
jgi:hypothetical protein